MGGGANWEYKTIIFWDQRSSTKDNCRYTVMKMKVLTFTEIYCWRVWVIKSLTEGWSIEFTRKQRSNCLSISSAFASEKNTFCEVSITHIPPLQPPGWIAWHDSKTEIFTKLKKSAKRDIFGSWVIKYQIGSDFRPTCSQNFRSLASKTTKIWVVFWIPLKIRNFHKIKKISQTRHFW